MVDTKKIFTVWSDKAVDRLDPFFYIPSEYKFDGKYLGDFIIKITSGKNVNRQNFTETGIPFLRVQNLKKYEIEPGELFLPNDAKYPKTGIETFLTGRVGSLGVFVQARGEYFYSDNALAIEFDDNSELNLDFLEAVLNSPIVTEQIIKLSKGNNQKLVSQETIKNLKIPVPPLSVQNQIVARIQQAYEEKKQKEAEIKTILASIDSFVLGELGIEIERERERERVSEPAQIWQIWSDAIERRLDPMFFHPLRLRAIEAIKNSNASVIPLSEAVKFRRELVSDIPENAPYVGLENIVSNSGEYIETNAKESISSAFVFKKGDVLFPKLRPYLNKVFYADFDGICSTEFHVFEAEKCDPYFLFSFLTRSVVVEQTSRLMTGNTLPRLQTEDIENLLIPIPNETTQEKIVAGVKTIYNKARTLRQEAETVIAEAQKQTAEMIFA